MTRPLERMRVKSCTVLVSALLPLFAWADPPSDAAALRAHLRSSYPSFAYVERYRAAYADDVQGDAALWADAPLPPVSTPAELVSALVGLQDYHVSVKGAGAGPTETLGVLFRTSTDKHMVVWRVFDRVGDALTPGDVVLAIDGLPTADWLARAQAVTFGGHRRSRAAQSAFKLGMGSRATHQLQGVGSSLALRVQSGSQPPRTVTLHYHPMTEERAAAMVEAVGQRDLPRTFVAAGTRLGTVRLGVFAPQYDAAFIAANDAAEKLPGVTEDQAMVAGFCAVVRNFVAEFDAVAEQSDAMVVDLRGNMGGFVREARLLAAAMLPSLPKTFDAFPSGQPGVLRLDPQPDDPPCGQVKSRRPVIVMTDAGTRSAGEFTAAWLWAAGASLVGERTIGAGGGLEAGSRGFALPGSSFRVSASESFAFFDPQGDLKAGEASEAVLVHTVAADRFAPSRTRPFAIQAVGMRPDVESASSLTDLLHGGREQMARAVRDLRARGVLK